ncbi:FG-GAP-like repeat-containing protein [Corallibacter sp.]|uniref:FG-GAP-like repeat-containing protein n=1 Tax=Corallibacter sp. TaxID=2038084 RepID=UPI003AB50959
MKKLLLSFTLVFTISISAQNTIYVDVNVSGGNNDGTSWTNAYEHLTDALNAANNYDEIRVAQGNYYPDLGAIQTDNDRSSYFLLNKNYVNLLGGYNTSNNSRDPELYPTILNGDIQQNNNDQNFVYTIFWASGDYNVIDGFTITNSNADNSGGYGSNEGGGMFARGANATVISNCKFINNKAINTTSYNAAKGGAIYIVEIEPGSLIIRDCTFETNMANEGGAIYNNTLNWDYGGPIIDNCTFSSNTAGRGGAFYMGTTEGTVIKNSIFDGNSSGSGGGAIYTSGNSSLPPVIENCSFTNNSHIANNGISGSAIYFNGTDATISKSNFSGNSSVHSLGSVINPYGNILIDKCQFSNNSIPYIINLNENKTLTITNTLFNDNASIALSNGNGIINISNSSFSNNSTALRLNATNGNTLYNSIIWNNTTNIQSFNGIANTNIIQGGYSNGTNILDTNPLFVDETNQNYRLQSSSPAIDFGNNSYNNGLRDLDNNLRLAGNNTDLGAYEHGASECPTFSNNVMYVNANNTSGYQDGSSWAYAFSSLQNALDMYNSNCGTTAQEVWVAQGTYYPDDGNNQIAGNRDESFHLPEDIIILGGFSGTETNSNQRDWENNITVLSGDINAPNQINDNSYNIIKTTNVGNNMLLDGFTIEKGNAVKISTYGQRAGAWLNRTTLSGNNSTPNVKNCIFQNNQSSTSAGALFLDGVTGSTVGINFEYCTFKNNSSTGGTSGNGGNGGAITIETFSGEATINVYIENCIFNGNSANQNGGAIWSRQNANDDGVVNITNSLFYGNVGTGGGISILDNGVTTYNIVNCTLTENDGDSEAGAGIRVWNGTTATVNIHNSILWDNTRANDPENTQLNTQIYAPNSNTTHCIINNIYNTNSNSSNDPLFVDALNKNFRVSETSSAIDSGLSTHNNSTFDLDGNERIIGSNIDRGAYEFDSCIGSPNVLYVNASATGANDGSNWSNAFTSLQDAINNALCANEIWVASGTYKPGLLETDSFTIPSNITVLGGFDATETSANERNWAENPTILSGDLNNDNTSNSGDSHSIITLNENNVTLDGFIIENGYADDDSDNTQVAIGRTGAGIYIRNAENININNCIFKNNIAYGNGIDNGVGGAIINFGNSATTTTITNSLFFDNIATAGGGAISAESGNLTTVNCTIANNTASHGGGIHTFAGNVTATNSIFTNNSGSNGNINNGGTNTSVVSHCLFFNNTSGNNGNIPSGINDGGNNIENTDPLYVDGYKLTDSSPAIDAGDNNFINLTEDLDGNPRISNVIIDLGAYEYFNANIGIAKSATVNSTSVTFDYYIENLGLENLSDLSITEDLDMVFGSGNYSISSPLALIDNPGSLSINNNFNGTTDTEIFNSGSSLSSGNTAQIQLVIEVTNITDQGNGEGEYSTQNTINANFGSVLVTDLSDSGTDPDPNGDGNPNHSGENDPTLFTVTPLPSIFTEVTPSTLPALHSSSVAWGDYNNDGFLDILMSGHIGSGSVARIYKNNGDGTFSYLNNPLSPGNFTGIQLPNASWGDYDNDGDLDIIIAGRRSSNFNPTTSIYTNNGNDTFTELTTHGLPGVIDASITWGDYDNDGDLDILLTGDTTLSSSGGEITKVYKNNGNGTFSEETAAILPVVTKSKATWADFNNDGYLDILLAGDTTVTSGGGISSIYLNNHDGSFTELTTANLTGVDSFSAIACADYNNDGYIDIMISGFNASTRTTKIFTNNAGSSFTELVNPVNGTQPFPQTTHVSLAWGDYNNDGNIDILLSGAATGLGLISEIYTNNGDSTFSKLDINLNGVFQSSFAWGDYDNDGDLDLIATGKDTTSGPSDQGQFTAIYKNNTITSNTIEANTIPSAPTNVSSVINSNQTITITWNTASDNETPSSGLSYNILIKENPIGSPEHVISPMAQENNGWRKIAQYGNTMLNNSFTWNIPDNYLGENTQFTVKVQAIDNAFAGSPFSDAHTINLNTLNTNNHYFNELSIYPNPVKDVLNIKTSSQEYSYHLFNIQGQEVLKANNQTSKTIDVSKLPSGIYILKLTDGDKSQSFKVIKQN